jgi:hypothetical protein
LWDYGGAFYAQTAAGYQEITSTVRATISILPNGAGSQNINGTAYFTYGGAYDLSVYSSSGGSGVVYEVVAKPL